MNKMYWSKSFHKTIKDNPADAEIPSHQLLMRAGLVKKVAPGIYTYGSLILRSLKKLENIIREELDVADCQEVLMPMVQPQSLWEETGRRDTPELLKFKNRSEQDFCLGATHEEVITDYVRNDLKSYKELPVTIYQIQTKYRDEIRPRFGLMRGREFIMKDAYSFDVDTDSAKKSYARLRLAYQKIFDRIGLDYRIVNADGGNIGGSLTEEFQVLADIGEDLLLVSDGSDFAANKEICERIYQPTDSVQFSEKKEEFPTPGAKTIADLSRLLNIDESHLVKTLFFKDKKGQAFAVLLRGCDELNPIKLKNRMHLSAEPEMLSEKEVEDLTGAKPGSCGPQGLNIKVYADHYLKEFKSYIVGANKNGVHLKGLKPGDGFKIESFDDLAFAKSGDPSPDGKGLLKEIRGIEVGHIFYLGTKYSKSMKALYQDESGKAKPLDMGCYGIGVGRTVQSAIEQSHDENGICWPKALAPFDFHFAILDLNDNDLKNFAEKLLSQLVAAGYTVFVDDRDERPGVKFKDADLIGLPVRVTFGQKSFQNNKIEVVIRKKNQKSEVDLEKAFEYLVEKIEGAF